LPWDLVLQSAVSIPPPGWPDLHWPLSGPDLEKLRCGPGVSRSGASAAAYGPWVRHAVDYLARPRSKSSWVDPAGDAPHRDTAGVLGVSGSVALAGGGAGSHPAEHAGEPTPLA